MHFTKCRKQNMFVGCSQKPHGHLWLGVETLHSLILHPHLTSKAVASKAVSDYLLILGYDQVINADIFVRLEEEIKATDLPEESNDSLP